MREIRPRDVRITLLVACGGWAALLAGCGDARFGSDLPRQPRATALRQTEPTRLRLPQDGAFSIVLPQVHRQPGLDGTAESDAQASGDGRAVAQASVTQTGQAEGLFQLGHAFRNSTGRQVDIAFTVRVEYAFELAASPETAYPDAQVGLRLYARDGRGRLRRELVLVEHSTENGPVKRQSDSAVDFTLTLAPGETVNVFLAGRARVELEAGRSGSARLEVGQLEMEAVTQPAPAVRTGEDAP